MILVNDWLPAMKHLDEWTISKLRLNNCFHKNLLLFENDSLQKQPSRGVFKKRGSENMQQIYKRTPMQKCDFN